MVRFCPVPGAQVRGTVAGRGALRARAQHGLGNCAVEVPAESSRQPRRVRGGWRGRQRARYAGASTLFNKITCQPTIALTANAPLTLLPLRWQIRDSVHQLGPSLVSRSRLRAVTVSSPKGAPVGALRADTYVWPKMIPLLDLPERVGEGGGHDMDCAEAALCALSSRLCIQRPVLRPCTQGQPVAPPGGSGIRHVGGGDARHRALEAYRTCAQAVCLEGEHDPL